MLNKQKGNMYGFVTHTWNVIKGKCPHDCLYCYMKVFPQSKMHIDNKEFYTNLGSDNYIFVGSSFDMFADDVPDEWIKQVLNYCDKFDNHYLFQTKNPKRFKSYCFPKNTTLCITLETNRDTNFKCPNPKERVEEFSKLYNDKMITIEPILDFDLDEFVKMIIDCEPKQVNIGADSKNHNLTEPSKEKVLALIDKLKKSTIVINKENLSRIQ